MKNAIFRDFFELKVSRKIWIFVIISIILHFIALYILSTLPFEAKPLPRRVQDDNRTASNLHSPTQSDRNERWDSETSRENREPEEEVYEGAEGPKPIDSPERKSDRMEPASNREQEIVNRRGEGVEGAPPAGTRHNETGDQTRPAILPEAMEAEGPQDTAQREKPPVNIPEGATAAAPITYETTRRSTDLVNMDEMIQLYRKPFQDPRTRPISLFSFSVGRLSFRKVRRAIRQRELPEADVVKIEELINYFHYDYPPPQGTDLVSITAELAQCPWNPSHRLLHIGLKGKIIYGNGLKDSQFVLAKDVKIRVTFNPGKVKAYRLIGYGSRTPKVGGYGRSNVGAAEIRAGQRITSLYEIIPADSAPGNDQRPETAAVLVSYREPNDIMPQQVTQLIFDQTETSTTTTDNFKFSAAVAQFGMILTSSELKDESSLDKLIKMAKDAVGEDKYGYRKQFIQMVEEYKKLKKESARNR